MLVIDEHSWKQFVDDPFVDGEQKSRGWIPHQEPYGSKPYATPFNLPTIPRSEWPARIAELERNEASLQHLIDHAGLPVKDQARTNYCWINNVAHGLEINRLVMGLPKVLLSPASAGGPITGFRNVGGWSTPGLKWVAEKGLVPVDRWPANAIDRRYYTAENQQIALQYRFTEWWELRPRNFDQVATCLLLGVPVLVGLNWWRHAVTYIKLVQHGGGFGVLINNSWGTRWGENGRAVLSESKATPDDAIAPRVVLA